MTRQQAIDRWRAIIPAVFRAEDKLQGQWRDRLSAAKEMPPGERTRLAEEYVTALATEIVSQTTDEELTKLLEDEQ